MSAPAESALSIIKEQVNQELHQAITEDDFNRAKELVAAGADPHVPDSNGETAWKLAESKKEYIELFVRYGADFGPVPYDPSPDSSCAFLLEQPIVQKCILSAFSKQSDALKEEKISALEDHQKIQWLKENPDPDIREKFKKSFDSFHECGLYHDEGFKSYLSGLEETIELLGCFDDNTRALFNALRVYFVLPDPKKAEKARQELNYEEYVLLHLRPAQLAREEIGRQLYFYRIALLNSDHPQSAKKDVEWVQSQVNDRIPEVCQNQIRIIQEKLQAFEALKLPEWSQNVDADPQVAIKAIKLYLNEVWETHMEVFSMSRVLRPWIDLIKEKKELTRRWTLCKDNLEKLGKEDAELVAPFLNQLEWPQFQNELGDEKNWAEIEERLKKEIDAIKKHVTSFVELRQTIRDHLKAMKELHNRIRMNYGTIFLPGLIGTAVGLAVGMFAGLFALLMSAVLMFMVTGALIFSVTMLQPIAIMFAITVAVAGLFWLAQMDAVREPITQGITHFYERQAWSAVEKGLEEKGIKRNKASPAPR